LVLVLLAIGSTDAHAAAYAISFEPQSPLAGEQVTFHAERVNPGKGGGDSFTWEFGDGATGAGEDPTHIYAAAGTYTVVLSVTGSDGTTSVEDTAEIEVKAAPGAPPANSAPSASFTFAPAGPVAGEVVSFTEQVSDPDGDAVTLSWDFGDGATSTGSSPTHAYLVAGSYTVVLTATDEHGAATTTFQTLTVAPPAKTPPSVGTTPDGSEPPADAVTPPPAALVPVMMRPFPIVRIAGVVLPTGARVRIMSVRAPRGARLRLRCRGPACPVRLQARTSTARVVRFRRFERTLPAGTTLEVFVRQTGKIGKYTRFLIRAGKAPARIDRCLVPGRARPSGCV